MKQGTARIKCKCTHEFQDKQYGAGTRIANTTGKQDKDHAEVRCTVCQATQRVSTDKVR